MIKFLLLCTIVICSLAIGNVAAKENRHREKDLVRLGNQVKMLNNAMVERNMTLVEGLVMLNPEAEKWIFEAVAECMLTNKCHAEEALKLALEENQSLFRHLAPEDIKLLREYLMAVSAALLPEQIVQAEQTFLQGLGSALHHIRHEQSRKAKIIRTLSLAGGLAVAILLA